MIGRGVQAVCDALEIDPWATTSCGSLLIAVDSDGVEDVRRALEDRGTVVAEIGSVGSGSGVVVEAGGDQVRLEHPSVDPSWGAYAELADDSSN